MRRPLLCRQPSDQWQLPVQHNHLNYQEVSSSHLLSGHKTSMCSKRTLQKRSSRLMACPLHFLSHTLDSHIVPLHSNLSLAQACRGMYLARKSHSQSWYHSDTVPEKQRNVQGAAAGSAFTPTRQAQYDEQVRVVAQGLGSRAYGQHTWAICCSAAISAARRGLLPFSGCPFNSSAAMVSTCIGAISASGARACGYTEDVHTTCQQQVLWVHAAGCRLI